MLSNQVVASAPASLRERELVSATVGGSGDVPTQTSGPAPTNGDAPTARQNRKPDPSQGTGKAMTPQAAAGERPASMALLYIWILLFGFVGTQLAWTLRPFFGSPDQPFELFRNIEGTFYSDIFQTLGSLLS